MMDTQRFTLVLATDGDVTEKEIGECLVALGYHGVSLVDLNLADPHEHPCSADGCIEKLRSEGHKIPDGTDCCVCWVLGK